MKILQRWFERQLAAQDPAWGFRVIMEPLARLYGLAVSLRNRRFDSGHRAGYRLPGRVISIGNLAVGGTGKSPVTIALATRLLQRGARPVILARGYGSGMSVHEAMVLLDQQIVWRSHASDVGASDEGLMQSAALPQVPIVLGADRIRAAKAFLAHIARDQPPTHWLLDDGFQHRAIARDIDIVLVDAARPLDSARLLPAGSLREPPSALARAQLVIATRARHQDTLDQIKLVLSPYYRGPLVVAPFVTTLPNYLPAVHAPVLIVAGIANPERFCQAIMDLGVEVASRFYVPDHASIPSDVLIKRLQGCRAVVTTAKDFWRDPRIFRQLPVPVFVAELVPQIDFTLVDSLLFD